MPTGDRDRLGRPLRGTQATNQAFWQVSDRTSISTAETIELARDYLQQDLPFHAHEVFEQRWRCCPPDERALWQALAQLGAAITHAARGNDRGAHRVGLRGLDKLLAALSAADQPSGSTGTGIDPVDIQDRTITLPGPLQDRP